MGKYTGIAEETLKNKVGEDFFSKFDHTETIKKIDFSVRLKRPPNTFDLQNDYLLWAEAKKAPTDISVMLAQLILTIGKARTFDKLLPPKYLGCFDCDKIAFIEYHEIHEFFRISNINWNVRSSNVETKEFKLILDKISLFDRSKFFTFDFVKNESELKAFIKNNFNIITRKTNKTQIDKGNFIIIYNRWRDVVKPTIKYPWEHSRRIGVIDGDFYLADLLSRDNKTIGDSLNVLLQTDYYEAERRVDPELDIEDLRKVRFTDKQKAHKEFWSIYERPPEKEFWDFFLTRRDLLVPKDIRERKGSFFTPEIWVELSQKYIADVFGEDWQDEYFVWDCAAGTGNLLAGLTNKRNIWASTLDRTDVDIMHSRIKQGELDLLDEHCFQFDFLNDDFKGLPKKLLDIINNSPEKLIVYINPPYAENTSYREKSKPGLSKSKVYEQYKDSIGSGFNEIFAQFLIRIYKEIDCCKIANFAKLKAVCASNFVDFRKIFQAKLVKLFVAPAYTFDNVSGKFPIGFHIWDTNKKTVFKQITASVYDEIGAFIGTKKFFPVKMGGLINDWYRQFYDENGKQIGVLHNIGNDFQQKDGVFISTDNNFNHTSIITHKNLLYATIYIAVRHCIETTWLNDRDQFLHPNDGWQSDKIFQSDCLAYTLFHNSNNVSSKHGTNHWIPFTEDEVKARDSFDSHFMLSFMTGKIIQNGYSNLFEQVEDKPCIKRVFSPEAKAVFAAGRALWRYYHEQPKCNVNASFYDIREYFQGRNDKGRMNLTSEDEKYNGLIKALRDSLKVLAKKIEPKIYEYGFLRE